MLIVETTVFTRRVVQLLPDESYRALQAELVQNPKKGAIIPGSGVVYASYVGRYQDVGKEGVAESFTIGPPLNKLF